MPRQGPRRPLLNLRVSPAEQDHLRERADQEAEGNVSELGRRMIRFASLAMPKDWNPTDYIHVPDPHGQVDYDPGDGRPPFKATQVCITPDVAARFNGSLDSDGYYQGMWRTYDGRWVFELQPMDMHKPDRYEFYSDQQAREWLERNKHDEAVEKYFGYRFETNVEHGEAAIIIPPCGRSTEDVDMDADGHLLVRLDVEATEDSDEWDTNADTAIKEAGFRRAGPFMTDPIVAGLVTAAVAPISQRQEP